jgi:hypothetical protein
MKLYSYEFSILFHTTQSIVSSALFYNILFRILYSVFGLLKGMRCEMKRREEYNEIIKKLKYFMTDPVEINSDFSQ